MKIPHLSHIVAAVMLVGALFACGTQSDDASGDQAGGAPDAATVLKKLAAADAIDGAEDKTISRCAGCNLGMDGSPEHARTVHDYTIQFCAASCMAKWDGDVDGKILAMRIPKE